MIVNQWVPAAHKGDAIGDSARRVRGLLRAMGHQSDLFALTIDDDLVDDVLPFADPAARRGDLTIFHYALPSPMTEALLMVASRAQLAAGVLRPALEAGRIVLCDRYGDSTLAYQGGGRGIDHALLAEQNRAATGGLVPALTLLFDVPVPVGLDRRHGSAGATNRLDREPAEFHERVRARYLELAAAEPGRWRVIDGTVGENELEARIWEIVGPRLSAART